MPAQPLFDYKQFDYDKPLLDLNEVRKVNPQRHEMEQLSGIVHIDREQHGLVGFKEVSNDEFWIKGHMPGFPLMPGVMLCEAAAQLAGFYARKYDLLGAGDYLGFGGMNDVRFRRPVYPDCRLIICARILKVRPKRLAEFEFQGFVDDKMVYNGTMIGVPISR
ncbi:3-hydroxyacyl-[acyl-carrier-protein] dehydratase FabZ [Thalassoglobus neptunius]|uniref:3-hydroxyacyl-[acyl-carrier-protein] dehydratase FabZ n=1 Tax=Thalassoglobus neptunius TaxID=1938619 RepID=A0A5C5X774_9PLAN|nr:3-hydroxyacyl-ACP dehydratase FabZ family protein [Thalassoglobus neptunius]TWT58790.1 3-hydroxyacyl-[acyl-carrier-protein] dehydratase FabZ [Thalassoglobus neptunius]